MTSTKSFSPALKHDKTAPLF